MIEKKTFHKSDRFILAGLCLFSAILVTWLYFSPPGLLGKADAVGYAVCHRISVRSFSLGERTLPLCARCSGMYLSAAITLLFHSTSYRKGGFPPRKILITLGFFLALFGIDGVNSYFHLLPNFPGIYEPNNVLRLLTGTGMGIGMSALLAPVFHQSIWQNWDPAPAITGWWDFLVVTVGSFLISALMLTANPLVLYPLALISAFTVVYILGLVYTIVWVMAFKKDNTFNHFSEIIGYLAFGFSTAILQILVIDLIRLAATGTWNGFNFF